MKLHIVLTITMIFLLSSLLHAAEVTYFLGDVTLYRKQSKIPVSVGRKVYRGDTIKTGKNGLVIIKLAENRVIKLNRRSSLVVQQIDNKKDTFSMQLRSGSIFSKLQKNKNLRFRISTKTTVAAVRGTEFYFSYGKQNSGKYDLWLCVNRGKVSIKNTKTRKEKIISEGEGIFIESGDKLTDPKQYKWTRKLNWNTDPDKGSVVDKTKLEDVYTDFLQYDYD